MNQELLGYAAMLLVLLMAGCVMLFISLLARFIWLAFFDKGDTHGTRDRSGQE